MKKLFAIMMLFCLFLTACGEKTIQESNYQKAKRAQENADRLNADIEWQKSRKKADVDYWKSREICIDGLTYFQPSNGGAPTPKIGPDGLPVKCEKQ